MQIIIQSSLETIKKNWKWLLVFLFLPTFNGCEPSVGLIYPTSILDVEILDMNNGQHATLHSIELSILAIQLLVGSGINLLLFLASFEFLNNFYNERKAALWVMFCFLGYHSVLSIQTFIIKDTAPTFNSPESSFDFLLRTISIFFESESDSGVIISEFHWFIFQILWLTVLFFISWGIGSIVSLFRKK